MRPTAIGAPAPEPDDEPTLAELLANLKALGQQAKTMAGLYDQLAEAGARVRRVEDGAAYTQREQQHLRTEAWKEESKIRQAELWDMLAHLRNLGPPPEMGPEIPGLD